MYVVTSAPPSNAGAVQENASERSPCVICRSEGASGATTSVVPSAETASEADSADSEAAATVTVYVIVGSSAEKVCVSSSAASTVLHVGEPEATEMHTS